MRNSLIIQELDTIKIGGVSVDQGIEDKERLGLLVGIIGSSILHSGVRGKVG